MSDLIETALVCAGITVLLFLPAAAFFGPIRLKARHTQAGEWFKWVI